MFIKLTDFEPVEHHETYKKPIGIGDVTTFMTDRVIITQVVSRER